MMKHWLFGISLLSIYGIAALAHHRANNKMRAGIKDYIQRANALLDRPTSSLADELKQVVS